jgi:alkanesulfonate monooxygenase SsuD/methylene tetrahydromethanopterin reductase-like flavin-dependent oxidoreductase (luciferase family)
VAALREGMLRLAGREGDGAIINWLSADDVDGGRPWCTRAGGEDREVVARIFVCPSENAEVVRAAAKFAIAAYLNVPVYAAFHDWLGRGDALAPMWDAWRAGDRKAALAAIPDEVVDDLVVHGSPEQCRARIQRVLRQRRDHGEQRGARRSGSVALGAGCGGRPCATRAARGSRRCGACRGGGWPRRCGTAPARRPAATA